MNRYNIDITEITTHLATHQPRALELTMTEEQLFRQQNPLWAKAYTKSDMEIIAQMYFYLSYIHYLDVLPGLKTQDSRLPKGKRAQFSSPTLA